MLSTSSTSLSTSGTSWNNTILCVDDEPGVLDFYRQVLSPVERPAIDTLREVRARRRSWRVDEEPVIPHSSRHVVRLLIARSGEEAIELVQRERAEGRAIAAGFFDMKMPGGIDGLETIRAIKEIDPRLLCAVVTAYTDRAISQLATLFRNQDEWIYFNKPFTEWELHQAVHHLVSGWNLRREREVMLCRIQESNQQLHEVNDLLLNSYMATVRAVVGTLEARDPYTAGHSQRVAQLATMLARKLGLRDAEVRRIYEGAILHDIGKVGISDCILHKTGRLTPEELASMQTHPTIGANIVAPVGHLAEAVQVIKHHHERFDGTGYPDGLRGDRIPLGARIVAVADTFDAMTSTRPYRRAMSVEQTCAEIVRVSGSQHDPELARAFLALMHEERDQIAAWLSPDCGGFSLRSSSDTSDGRASTLWAAAQ